MFKILPPPPSVSTGTLPHSCIFPQSCVAFLVVPVSDVFTDWPPTERSQPSAILLKRLSKFCETHQKCFAIVCAPMFGSWEQRALSVLQQRFLLQHLQVMPAHNSSECVECMITIAQVASKPTCVVMRDRLQGVRDLLLSEEYTLSVVQQAGFSGSDSMLLLDGIGSVAGIARASAATLQECSLDGEVIKKVYSVFHGNNE